MRLTEKESLQRLKGIAFGELKVMVNGCLLRRMELYIYSITGMLLPLKNG
jgi:hypothetical protein